MKTSYRRAFTLIEMMLVVTVLGIVMIAVAPRIGERISLGDEQVAFLNDLIKEHYQEAVRQGAPVVFTGFKGSANIEKYDGSRVTIPGVKSVQSASVNEHGTGIEYRVTIYPDGLCDYFVLETDKYKIVSNPLLMSVEKRSLR